MAEPVTDAGLDSGRRGGPAQLFGGPARRHDRHAPRPLTSAYSPTGLSLALGALHEACLIHRGLKASNVLVTVDSPRVIDLGIARTMESLTGESLHTRTGMPIGSPGFMSPQQIRGLALTPPGDVFSLGAVLVSASTGRLLFGAPTQA